MRKKIREGDRPKNIYSIDESFREHFIGKTVEVSMRPNDIKTKER